MPRTCVSAAAPGLPVSPQSQSNPYHLAMFTHEMIRAASCLAADFRGADFSESGISGLLAVIEERASLLAEMLDAGAFCEDWPALAAEIDQDPSLGILKRGAEA